MVHRELKLLRLLELCRITQWEGERSLLEARYFPFTIDHRAFGHTGHLREAMALACAPSSGAHGVLYALELRLRKWALYDFGAGLGAIFRRHRRAAPTRKHACQGEHDMARQHRRMRHLPMLITCSANHTGMAKELETLA